MYVVYSFHFYGIGSKESKISLLLRNMCWMSFRLKFRSLFFFSIIRRHLFTGTYKPDNHRNNNQTESQRRYHKIGYYTDCLPTSSAQTLSSPALSNWERVYSGILLLPLSRAHSYFLLLPRIRDLSKCPDHSCVNYGPCGPYWVRNNYNNHRSTPLYHAPFVSLVLLSSLLLLRDGW